MLQAIKQMRRSTAVVRLYIMGNGLKKKDTTGEKLVFRSHLMITLLFVLAGMMHTEYAKWLSHQSGKSYRLPTDVEGNMQQEQGAKKLTRGVMIWATIKPTVMAVAVNGTRKVLHQ